MHVYNNIQMFGCFATLDYLLRILRFCELEMVVKDIIVGSQPFPLYLTLVYLFIFYLFILINNK